MSVNSERTPRSGHAPGCRRAEALGRTHFARWLHWARELYMDQKIEMILVEDSDMMADCDTKIVDRDKFFKCIKFQMNL